MGYRIFNCDSDVLLDGWYAIKDMMLFVKAMGRLYHVPLKSSRQVNQLCWGAVEQVRGKTIKIRGFPKDHKVKLFRLAVSTRRTDWSVTNNLAQGSWQFKRIALYNDKADNSFSTAIDLATAVINSR